MKEILNVIRHHRTTGNIGETEVNLSKRRQNEVQLFEEGLKEMEQQSRSVDASIRGWTSRSAKEFNSGLSIPVVVRLCVTGGVGLLPGCLFYKWCFGKGTPQTPENKAATEEANDEATEMGKEPESGQTTLFFLFLFFS